METVRTGSFLLSLPKNVVAEDVHNGFHGLYLVHNNAVSLSTYLSR